MKLSIIIPIYNVESYLRRCLDSVKKQTFTNFEVLLVDDGSTDESGNIADEYVNSDKRFRVFHVENGGVSSARNIGLKNAVGEFIAFVDSDDCIKCNMYERLLDIQSKTDVDLVTSDLIMNGRVIDNNLSHGVVYNEDQIKNEVLPLFTKNGSVGTYEFKNKIIRKHCLKANNIHFYSGFSYQEDLMFMINVYGNIKSMYYLNDAFYEYYPLSTGLYSSYRKESGTQFIAARKIMLELVHKYNIAIDDVNFNISFLYNISYYIFRTLNRVNSHLEQKRLIKRVLNDDVVVQCCKDLVEKATSFDKRIAYSIYNGHYYLTIWLIKFVYSGKAEKLQKQILKIKEK